MEISLHGGGIGNLDKWALLQVSRLVREERNQRRSEIQNQLSQLLFGVDLKPHELDIYRARLLDAITKVEHLESETRLAVPGNLAIPRSNLMFGLGNVGWLPARRITKTVEVSPAQEIHSRNLARAVKTALSLNPKSVRSSFHSVGIIVAQGSEGTRWGEDKVELTQWGMKIMNSRDFPKVARLRLPPRFPSRAEMVKFRAS